MAGEASGASILLVDDNPNKLRALEAVLAPLGVETTCATSGREALRFLLAHTATVIILDVCMPGMDGFETAELIRSRPRTERTPILFVTAFDQVEADMTRGFALGAVDFVLSPIVPEILRNKVSVLVDLFEATERVRRQSEELLRLETARNRTRLARAENKRRRAEQRFATILDLAGDAILAINAEGRVAVFNRAAERIFMREAARTIGEQVDQLIVDGASCLLDAAGAVGALAPREVQGLRSDGSRFAAEASVSATDEGGDRLWSVILRDVTERREAEAHLRGLHDELDERLRIGIDLVAALAEPLDAQLVLDRLLVQAATAVGAQRGTLVRLDGETLLVGDVRELNHVAPFDRAVSPRAQPMLLEAMTTGRPVMAAEFDPDRLPAAVRCWGGATRHVAVVPLSSGQTVMALLLLCKEDEEPFSAGDVETLELIAKVAVVALRNADLYGRAEASSRSKSQFLNLAAHELRTPLSVIRGYLSLLDEGSLGDRPVSWKRPLEAVMSKADELNGLVDDLLTAARLEARSLTPSLVSADLREVASAAVSRHMPHAQLLDGTIELHAPDATVLAAIDAGHTGRILDNLIGNALTYTVDPPQIRVTVDAEERSILVEDRGPGIPQELHDRLFDQFTRADHPQIRPRAGTGLGLYIARSLAERQGALLALVRTGPEGSVFAVTFQETSAPLDGPAQPNPQAALTG